MCAWFNIYEQLSELLSVAHHFGQADWQIEYNEKCIPIRDFAFDCRIQSGEPIPFRIESFVGLSAFENAQQKSRRGTTAATAATAAPARGMDRLSGGGGPSLNVYRLLIPGNTSTISLYN